MNTANMRVHSSSSSDSQPAALADYRKEEGARDMWEKKKKKLSFVMVDLRSQCISCSCYMGIYLAMLKYIRLSLAIAGPYRPRGLLYRSQGSFFESYTPILNSALYIGLAIPKVSYNYSSYVCTLMAIGAIRATKLSIIGNIRSGREFKDFSKLEQYTTYRSSHNIEGLNS